MKYTNNAIYTKVYNAVKAVESNAFVTQTYTPKPSTFPTVFIREIGRFTPQKVVSFSNAQDLSDRTWEVQVFSNLASGAKEQAYNLMDAVKNAFRGLYFREASNGPIEISDKSIYCLAARFEREIGSGEDIPS